METKETIDVHRKGFRKQTVVFVRHGIARHNLLDPRTGQRPDLTDPNLLDPPLVRDGKFQAIDIGERLRKWWKNETQGEGSIEIVISSPLTRCLQTASLAFLPGDLYCEGSTEPDIVCLESVREAYGMHYPDQRRKKSFLVSQWPAIDFDAEMREDDDWQPDKRESFNNVIERVNHFLINQLIRRPEQNIVVVSHGVWIECCFRTHFPSILANGARVYNGDSFSAECISVDGIFQSLENVRPIE